MTDIRVRKSVDAVIVSCCELLPVMERLRVRGNEQVSDLQ
jgi:hypothetical protein